SSAGGMSSMLKSSGVLAIVSPHWIPHQPRVKRLRREHRHRHPRAERDRRRPRHDGRQGLELDQRGEHRRNIDVHHGPAPDELHVPVQLGALLRPQERTKLYRVVEFVGRWSMVDIYVAAMLTALVQFQALATIMAGAAAIAFGAGVAMTMFAAESFDSRLMWDPVRRHDG